MYNRITVQTLLDFDMISNNIDVMLFNQKIWAVYDHKTENAYFPFAFQTATELIYVRPQTKVRVINLPLVNDAKWS